MDLQELRDANAMRQREWDVANIITLSFRGCELAGEVGELCNKIKKLERSRLNLPGGVEDYNSLAEELADVIICADLIAMHLGLNLSKAIREKFNKTSIEKGLSTRL